MRKTFELAGKGLGNTWPNPLVGSVIIKDGKIIGEGFHARCGEDHAEVAAINNCSGSIEGATVFVNLEPCCHIAKRTPPCAQRLIQEKVKRVIISNLDPNPEVNGKGVALLRAAGIEVEHGLLAAEGERLNEVFFLSQRRKRPFIHLKLASTLDGKMALASGESKWITGEASRARVHELRSQHQAVMVGAGTIRMDDPQLNVRLPSYKGPQPYRVVISSSGDLPISSKIFTDELKDKTLLYGSIEEALEKLYQQKIISVFLEGGSRLAGSFLSLGLVDRVSLFLNPSFLGKGLSILEGFSLERLSERPRLRDLELKWSGEDLYLTGRLN